VEGAADDGWIAMGVQELYLYKLGEAALNKVLTAIEVALPTKKRVYAGQKVGAGRGGRGVTKLSKHGRWAVKMLKKALPKVRPTELKLMLKALKPSADVAGSKEELINALLHCILPDYPIDDDDQSDD
jgi:hypothetical protein